MKITAFSDTPFFLAIKAIAGYIKELIATLQDVPLMRFGSLTVSLWEIIVGFLIIGMVVTVFWKGARA